MTLPIRLATNQPPRFYRGGAAIASLRGEAPVEYGPEDWVASCTTLHGEVTAGLSVLPNGKWLRDAIRADPEHWLGPDGGTEPALLVKLLDAGQRLPVHCHPSNSFAQDHFGSRYGKTEAWVIAGTTGPSPTVHIGFSKDRDAATVANWVARQDAAAMLAALNPVAVRPGDAVFVPAGVPHAIGEGVFLVELQQPTDLSVMLEWQGFVGSAADGHLGVGYETALGCVDLSAWEPEELVRRLDAADPVVDLFDAPEFFQAQRIRAGAEFEPSYAVLVVLDGSGRLSCAAGDLALGKGDTVVVPYGAGRTTLGGELTAIRCLPGSPR
jgi:mannose-6-phosphate isomerase